MSNRLYMLDTNIASFLIRDKLSGLRKYTKSLPEATICISVITKAELLFGVARMPDAINLNPAVRIFLTQTDTLPWDDEAAEAYGTLRAFLQFRGIGIGPLDLLIAAHALSKKAILVTNDKTFRRIKNLETEDWTRK